MDKQVIKTITGRFGKDIWRRALVVLTHAQLSPPDGLEGLSIPVVLVENCGRCNKNPGDEKILPNGTAWIPNLVKTITEVAVNGSKPILVDRKLIEGPNPNGQWKELIPLIFACQYFFIVKPNKRAIKSDIDKEAKPAWELWNSGWPSRRF